MSKINITNYKRNLSSTTCLQARKKDRSSPQNQESLSKPKNIKKTPQKKIETLSMLKMKSGNKLNDRGESRVKTESDWRCNSNRIVRSHTETIRVRDEGVKTNMINCHQLNQWMLCHKNSSIISEFDRKTRYKSKIQDKIPDHRRIRSTSKIAQTILGNHRFFRSDSNFGIKNHDQNNNQQITTYRQKQSALQNLLQLKIKIPTSPEHLSPSPKSPNPKYPKNCCSLLQRTSKQSKGLIIKKQAITDILQKQQLIDSKSQIHENQEMRKTQNLHPHPKQWQFFKCLTLQNIQLYRTNLRISCQNWVVFDYLELKYLRGWNPKHQDDFSPIIRLFIAKIAFDFGHKYGCKIDLDKIFVRVNDKHIYFDQRERVKDKNRKLTGIPPQTILTLRQLITATTLTNHHDLITYSILALGYLILKIRTFRYPSPRVQKMPISTPEPETDPFKDIKKDDGYLVFIKQNQASKLQKYCQCFEQECSRVCEEIQLNSTRVLVGFTCLYRNYWGKCRKNQVIRGFNQVNQFIVVSSSLDAALLFMTCLAIPEFKSIFEHRIYEAEVKFQVGWNFWENKLMKWPNHQYLKYRLKGIGGRTNKGNECFVIWDQRRDLIISMGDSKINMHWKDTEMIVDWIERHIPRFSKNYSLAMSFYRTDTQKFMKIT